MDKDKKSDGGKKEMTKIVGNVDEIRKQLAIPETKKEIPEKTAPRKPISSGISLGRMFLYLVGVIAALLVVGKIIGFFGPLNFAVFSFWPLLFIFLGLSLFKVQTAKGKFFGGLTVVVLFLLAFGILFRGGSAAEVMLTGEVITEERDLAEFSEVIFEGVGVVEITESASTSVSITADARIVEHVVTSVEGDTLRITYKSPTFKTFLFDSSFVDVVVKMPNVEALYLAGAGEITGTGINADTLELSIEGSGDIILTDLSVNTLISKVSGAGVYTLSGEVERQIIDISGVGTYNADKLLSNESGIRVNGEGNVYVAVSDSLDAAVTGSGAIYYLGEPEILNDQTSASGVIEQQDQVFFETR